MKAVHIGMILAVIGVAGVGIILGYSIRRSMQGGAPPTIAGEPVVRPQELPPLYPVPAFSLTNAQGDTTTAESLKGKVWVAMFFFTSCAGPCPIMSAGMAEVAKQIEATAPVRFVSITVDPETDTPERLREYGARYGADFNRWYFLTGQVDAIAKLALEGFKLGSVDEPIMHSDRFVLVDGAGNIRGYFPGTEAEGITQLVNAIHTLLKETKA